MARLGSAAGDRPRGGKYAAPAGPVAVAMILGLEATMAAAAEPAPPIADLRQLSIEDLANVDISSVSKAPQSLSDAAAAIYVITHDDIVRSGATSIPEMLRLAPNLQVARLTSSSYAITARGFNGTVAAKLLVLIDGRSVYSPFQAGVFWDMQDVLPEDVERIEVISGPGATLWGANAVNGVINIITRRSDDTQGAYAEAGAGNLERRGTAQYGGKIGDATTYRVYMTGYDYLDGRTAAGTNALDGWDKYQGGFRVDWKPAGDLVTVQGDAYQGFEDNGSPVGTTIAGQNVIFRWTHEIAAGQALQVQTYYDYTSRGSGSGTDYLHTYDLDVQHSFSWGGWQHLVLGGGYRVEEDNFPTTPSSAAAIFFAPQSRMLELGNVFVEDTIALTDTLKFTAGTKLEESPYVRPELLPSLRLSWKPTESQLLWSAVSRAVRSPSRLDRDLVETVGRTTIITTGDFQSEKLIAYELGYRAQPLKQASFSISTFYNDYRDLRSADFVTNGTLPVVFANSMEGNTYGVEAWGNYQLLDWWRLSGGANWLHKNLQFVPGSHPAVGIAIAGDDPAYQVSLRSAMDVTKDVLLDVDLRRIGALPNPASPAYTEMDVNIGWTVTRFLEVSLRGSNLLHDHHLEFGSVSAPLQLGSAGTETGRTFFIDVKWRF
jgi:iron complex outermembrane receptor protein